MNPHLLTLALTTPLEQLLELPNAVRIAACAREDLQRFSAEQLAQMLASMDAAITDTVTLAQIKHGGELVSRPPGPLPAAGAASKEDIPPPTERRKVFRKMLEERYGAHRIKSS